MKLYVRMVELLIGEDGENYTAITNIKSMKWRRVHNINPRLLPSSKIPVGWLQGHSWIEGEFILLSNSLGILSYYEPDGDSTIIPYFELIVENPIKDMSTFLFTGVLIYDSEPQFGDREGEVTYRFVAYKVIETGE